MSALLLGFATRFLPNVFTWFGKRVEDKADAKREAATMRLQLEIERARAAGAADVAGIDADSAEILAGIQAEMDEMSNLMEDRKSARQYGIKALERLNGTLQKGIDMGLSKLWLGLGWHLVLAVEIASAAVQPMMAIIVFAMWIMHKVENPAFGTEDWWLMECIIGFFLAGRVKKHTGTE